MRQEVLKVEIKNIQGEINSYVKEISDGEKQISKIRHEENKVIGQKLHQTQDILLTVEIQMEKVRPVQIDKYTEHKSSVGFNLQCESDTK